MSAPIDSGPPPAGAQGLVFVVLVTHGNSGAAMVDTAEKVVGAIPAVVPVGIEPGASRESVEARIEAAVDTLDGGEVLFLVDLFGSTPFRLCCRKCGGRSVVLTGVNMAMLFKLATADRFAGARALAAELAATGAKSIQIIGGSNS